MTSPPRDFQKVSWRNAFKFVVKKFQDFWEYPVTFDVIVVGAGHAGCEAAHAAARSGAKTLLLTTNLDTIAKMSCNPSIGGIGKGHIVREIDALGGIMGKIADQTGIHFRMLNSGRGPAVQAPRAQADKNAYHVTMKNYLESIPGLSIMQGTTESFHVEDGRIIGVSTQQLTFYRAKSVVLSAGTFMRGLLHIGEVNYGGGRAGDTPAVGISACLREHGFQLERLKTGTPPRLNGRTIDFSKTEAQPGEDNIFFSYDHEVISRMPQICCYITYTNLETHEIARNNLHRSALYCGNIQGIGPRYCPSFEDKVVRFADKERHQLFLEPEGIHTKEVYVNGISTSLPFDVQVAMLRTIQGLENAEIIRPAYAIEYDSLVSGQIKETLESKTIAGLFMAGQINGTTGYEEAAGQGLIAGINAAAVALEKPPFVLSRSEAYIGVMIDDLITKTIDEPYRMFTSRAEHRLLLRQDNADLRLREYGFQRGLITPLQYQKLQKKKEVIEKERMRFGKLYKNGSSLSQLLCRPEHSYASLLEMYPDDVFDHGKEINFQIELMFKYAGYIQRQESDVARMRYTETVRIPGLFNFNLVKGLSIEAKEKLQKFRPSTVGQATRIAGVSPADIQVLLIALKGLNS